MAVDIRRPGLPTIVLVRFTLVRAASPAPAVIARRALWVGTLSLLVSAIACAPADEGTTVLVSNRCDSAVKFSLEGGSPPPSPSWANSVTLGPGRSQQYSVIVGKGQPAYLWLREPEAAPVTISNVRAQKSPAFTLSGTPCAAANTSS